MKPAGRQSAIVIGAGLTGSVAARNLAEMGYEVDIFEKKPYPGGALFDFQNDDGIWIHTSGPHIFHTASDKVYNFVRRFCNWKSYQHRVLASIDGKLCPIPFNFTSIEMCFPDKAADEYKKHLSGAITGKESIIDDLKTSHDPKVRELADFIYNKIFLRYTQKQWGVIPEELGKEVLARVPVRASYEDRYFSDPYQMLPENGYTFFIRELLSHPSIHLHVNSNCTLHVSPEDGKILLNGEKINFPVVYTGCPDTLFSYIYGVLPYRTLCFVRDNKPWPFQPAAVVNYPNVPGYTRITEFKHFYPEDASEKRANRFTCANHSQNLSMKPQNGKILESVIQYEYPGAYDPEKEDNEPFYPIPTKENHRLFQKYADLASKIPNLYPAGRLGSYRYMNMDQAILKALDLSNKIGKMLGG